MYKLYPKICIQPPRCIFKILLMMGPALRWAGYPDKRKWIMRANLTTLLLISAILQVSATSFAQKVTLSEKKVAIQKIFDKIRVQTKYDFVFSDDILKDARPITIDVKDGDLKTVLNQIFEGQPLDFAIEDKSIVVMQKKAEKASLVNSADTSVRIVGKVVDENGEGLPGATIREKNLANAAIVSVGSSGAFSIQVSGSHAVLVVSYIGYKTKEIPVSARGEGVLLVIAMQPKVAKLDAVNIVSTGYQTLPKERATGSFEKIDNALFNRTVSTDIVSRLDGIAAGLLFDTRGATPGAAPDISKLSIRGISTLSAISTPLIVLDNFPYEGNITNINPNDVESITILKDAAAASIWGVRAGNGVIVITTKKGAYDHPMQVSFNSNVTVMDKPNLFAIPQMTTSDYIDVEKFLFAQGADDDALNDNFSNPYVSPVVELLAQERSGAISAATANSKIDALRSLDVKNDYLKYIYRKAVSQQYSLNLSGGSNTMNYIVSGGYDKDLGSTVLNTNNRLTMRTDVDLKPLKNLEFEVGSIYTRTQSSDWGSQAALNYGATVGVTGNFIFPYTRLADGDGNPLVVGRDYRTSFVQSAVQDDPRLVNWQYRPLAEFNDSSFGTIINDWLINLSGRYKLNEVFSFDVKYQYGTTGLSSNEWYGPGSYYMRNLINLFTQPVGSDVEQPLPPDKGMLSSTNSNDYTHTLRGQLNINKNWGDLHQFTAIAGAEQRQVHGYVNQYSVLGYDNNNLGYQNSDFNTYYPLYVYTPSLGFSGQLPSNLNFSETTYRYTSIYANAAYTYDNRYTLSASARKDASNLFGVNANQRGVPLWSAGVAWNINQEPFYHLDMLPLLKLRATYGYNGNTRNDLSAYSTIQYGRPDPYTNLPEAEIKNPENNSLQWEKVGILNLGLDFGFIHNRVSGSIEYYTKQGKDILYLSPLPYSTGFPYVVTNSVAMSGQGIDLSLHSSNLPNGSFKWNTDLNFSYNTSKVTRFNPITPQNASYYIGAGATSIEPILGKPLYAVYSYKWAGLDPQTGDPQGYDSQGKVSKDYPALLDAPVGDLQFSGSAIPVYFGNFMNTISWKNLSLSANIVYKLDYYFRRPSIDYGGLFGGGSVGIADYDLRWQKPGDEKFTNVPSMIYPNDPNRDQFYTNSATLVDRGDHIRLQDITASYSINSLGRYVKNIRLYLNISNLGIIWRANKQGIDPDYVGSYPAPKRMSLGLNANF